MSKSLFSKLLLFYLGITAALAFGTDPSDLMVFDVTSPSFGKEDLLEIERVCSLFPGRRIDTRKLDDGIRQLFTQGKIQSLVVEGYESDEAGGGSKFHVVVRGNRLRMLHELKFVDVDSEIIDDLKSRITIEPGQPLDLTALTAIREKLKEASELRGYYFAEVQIVIKDLPNSQQSDLLVTVHKNHQTIVSKIHVTGGIKDQNETLADLIRLRARKPFSKAALDEDIDSINKYLRANQYPTSKVEDTSLEFSPDRSAVDVTIIVRWNERVQFVFSGNRIFSAPQLRELLTEEVLSQSDANFKLAHLVEDKYKRVGYNFCRVRSEIDHRPRNNLNVVRISIHEGPKVIIDDIDFGNRSELKKSELEILFYKGAPGVIQRKIYWEEGLIEAVENFRTALEALGYLSASVPPPRPIYTDDRRGVQLLFDLEAGTRTRVKAYNITGNFHVDRSDLISELPLKENEPFNRVKLSEGRKNVITYYRNHGFLDVKYEGSALVNDGLILQRDQRDALVNVQLHEGEQYHVGEITIDGNKKTKSLVILREMKVQTGDVYNPDLVRKSEDNVASLGLFSKVEIIASANPGSPYVKDLKIVVRENLPGVGEIGLGLAYEDPRFRIRPFTNFAYRNLNGLNQTASFRGEISLPISSGNTLIPFLEYSALFGYRVPNPFDFPLTFSAQAGVDAYEVAVQGPTLQYRTLVEGRIEKKFSKLLTLNYRLYHYERTTTEVISQLDATGTFDSNIIAGILDRESIGSTGPGMILDFRDDIFNPSRGSYHTLDVEFATPILLSQSDISFVLVSTRNSFYIPLVAPFSCVFYAGAAFAQSLFPTKLPTARLVNDLSLGGRTSIRGFTVGLFQPSLTAMQAGYWNGRFELNSVLYSNISGAVFMDSGQIIQNAVFPALHNSVGIGLRYRTPVGPIVVDVADGLGSESQGIMFYFTAGTI